ncbi:MAG: hypothetical protein JNK83_11485 [Rhizobiales bacterium]|nr:hypothetical protein [Hyphomicrobiales bacterium]
MSDSNWGPITTAVNVALAIAVPCLILLAVWNISASNTEEAVTASYSAREYAANTENQIADRCTMTDLSALQACVNEIVKTSYENQRADYDLVAQNAVARWTFWLLILGIVGTVLTAIGVFFLQANLSEMKQQRAISKSAADAAIISNTLQSQALQQDRRALHVAQGPDLQITNIKLISFRAEDGLNVEITLTNKGKSAALITGVAIRQTVCEVLPTDPIYVDTNEFKAMGLHPTDSLILDSDPTKKQVSLSKAEYLAVALGKLLCIMYGRITFNDVFGNKFERGFIIQLESEQVSKDEKGIKFNFRLREPSDVGPFVYLREIPRSAKQQS